MFTSFKFVKRTLAFDDIGIQNEVETLSDEIPIVKIEDIYSKEFYEAEMVGYKPSLRLRISIFNFNDEDELIYGGKHYTIIRTQSKGDYITLICERKVKNV